MNTSSTWSGLQAFVFVIGMGIGMRILLLHTFITFWLNKMFTTQFCSLINLHKLALFRNWSHKTASEHTQNNKGGEFSWYLCVSISFPALLLELLIMVRFTGTVEQNCRFYVLTFSEGRRGVCWSMENDFLYL